MKTIKRKEYKIVLMPQVKNFLKKLPKKKQKQTLEVFEKIRQNPKIGKKVKNTKFRYLDFNL